MKAFTVILLCFISAVSGFSLYNQACVDVLKNLEQIAEDGEKVMKIFRTKLDNDSAVEVLRAVKEMRDEYGEKYNYKFKEPLKEYQFTIILAVAFQDADASLLAKDADTREMLRILKNEAREWRKLKTSLKNCPLDENLEAKKLVQLSIGFVEEFASEIKDLFHLISFFDA